MLIKFLSYDAKMSSSKDEQNLSYKDKNINSLGWITEVDNMAGNFN